MNKLRLFLFLPLLITVSACEVDEDTSNSETFSSDSVVEIWGDPTYTWNDDNSEVTAKRTSNLNKEEIETVTTTSVVNNATCSEDGSIVYTSNSFSNPLFEAQTKTVTLSALGHDWDCSYEWNYNEFEETYYVSANAVCTRNNNHTDSEVVKCSYSVVTEATCHSLGKGRYTASFSNNVFETQTRDVDIPVTSHNFANVEPTYKISSNFEECTASLHCINDGYVIYTVFFDDSSLESGEKREDFVTGGGEHEWVFVQNVYADFDPQDPFKIIPGYREYSCSCGAIKKEYHTDFKPL